MQHDWPAKTMREELQTNTDSRQAMGRSSARSGSGRGHECNTAHLEKNRGCAWLTTASSCPRLPRCRLTWNLAAIAMLAGIAEVALRTVPGAIPQATPVCVFRFTDVTEESGLGEALRGALNHATAWGDFDNDGRLDLFSGNFADRPNQPFDGSNQLFRQTAAGKFERVMNSPVQRRGRASGAVFADLDNDGWLDLYVANNSLPRERAGARPDLFPVLTEPCRLFRNQQGRFVDISETCGACPKDLYRARDIGVFDYDGDGLLDLFVCEDLFLQQDQRKPHSRLFRNLGGLKFRDVTAEVGLPDDIGGFGIAVADLNGDGRPDFFVAGSNRLFLSQPGNRYREAEHLRHLLQHKMTDRGEDLAVGASFGDINGDGLMDLIVGIHFAPARVHVFLNQGLRDGVPQFREITEELGLQAVPNKAPHTEIQDFDNDGQPDLYWSAWLAEGSRRWPFLCRNITPRGGPPKFLIPDTRSVRTEGIRKNVPPATGLGMVYYVDGPTVDYNGDGRLDLFAGMWPPEGSHLYRNDTPGGNWLQVRVVGRRMNRMGIGAQVRLYEPGQAGKEAALLGHQEITVNGGYSSGRPAMVHFGVGQRQKVDVVVRLAHRTQPMIARQVTANQLLTIEETP